MNELLRIACVQCNAGEDLDAGIAAAVAMTREAAALGARFVTLPEYFSQLDVRGGRLHLKAFEEARRSTSSTSISRRTSATANPT